MPVPGHGQIVIRVAYAGVNRPDALQRAGAYAPPPSASPLPGLEASGTVVEIGPGVAGWSIGDRVCALAAGRGLCGIRRDAARPMPCRCRRAWTCAQPPACRRPALPSGRTWCMRGGLQAGERFLVHGGVVGDRHDGDPDRRGAWGAGLRHCRVGREMRRLSWRSGPSARSTTATRISSQIVRAEGGADLILDMVGGAYLPRNVKALADDGRLVQIAFLQGAEGRAELCRGDDAAADDHRIDAAPAIGPGQGRLSRRDLRTPCLADDRSRQAARR